MSDNLQNAIKCLLINDVYIREFSSTVADDFEPKYSLNESDESTEIKFKHTVIKSEVVELESDNENQNILRVFIELGIKWVDVQNDSLDLVKIEATYIAEYLMKNELSQESIDEFALKNSSYHVWPYWREYISNTCQRMNLPKVMMPTMQFATNK